jgi:hypothetical protein
MHTENLPSFDHLVLTNMFPKVNTNIFNWSSIKRIIPQSARSDRKIPIPNTNIWNRDFSVDARSVENIAKFRRHLKCTTEPIHQNSNKQTNKVLTTGIVYLHWDQLKR